MSVPPGSDSNVQRAVAQVSGQIQPTSKPIEFDGFRTARRHCNISPNCGEFAAIKSQAVSDLLGGTNEMGRKRAAVSRFFSSTEKSEAFSHIAVHEVKR